MKKVLFFFALVLLAVQFVSPIEIEMKDEFSRSETLMASVSGNFIDPILRENVYFYRGYTRISLDYDVAHIGGAYYIYAQLGDKLPDNYSMTIKNVRYIVGGYVSDEDISNNFTILSETADFIIKPGFKITQEDSFSFEIKNIKDYPETISVSSKVDSGFSGGTLAYYFNNYPISDSFSFSPSGFYYDDLKVSLNGINGTTVRTITISSTNTEYNIPFYFIYQSTSPQNETQNTTQDEIPDETENNETLDNSSNYTYECTFFEKLFGGCKTPEEIQNETIIYENETQTIENKTGSSQEENKTEISQKNETGKNNSETEIPEKDYEIVLDDAGNTVIIDKGGKVINESSTLKTCSEIKGNVCSAGSICDGDLIYAKDNKCCIGSCVKEEKTSNKLVGWLIVALILIWVFWFFSVKFRGSKNKKPSVLDVAEKRRR